MDISGMGSMYTDYIAETADTLMQDTATKKINSASGTDEELMEVCKEFESYFLEQVFKEMNKTVDLTGSEDSSNKALLDYYEDTMIKDLAAQSTEQESLGLAQTLYEQMKRNYDL